LSSWNGLATTSSTRAIRHAAASRWRTAGEISGLEFGSDFVVAGFYLVDAKDLNEAIQIASGIPPAKYGSIEVRPVRQLDVGNAGDVGLLDGVEIVPHMMDAAAGRQDQGNCRSVGNDP
jgi:YCII-related domain